jgi:hypothetical protein
LKLEAEPFKPLSFSPNSLLGEKKRYATWRKAVSTGSLNARTHKALSKGACGVQLVKIEEARALVPRGKAFGIYLAFAETT